MKTFTIFMTASALMLGGCVTYQGGQTPDDVYYSPAQSPAPSYSGNRESYNNNNDNYADNDGYAVTENAADEGDYVTYQDGYDDYSYAARRYELFDRPNNFYNYSYYLNSPYSFSDPFLYNSYYYPSWGFSPYYSWGMGYPLYSSLWYPSFSLGISYGYPLGGWGHRYWGSPSYAYWNGYYDGYYGGIYSHGRYYDYNRPASTIAPRRSFTSSSITGRRSASPQGGSSTPVRIMRTDNNNAAGDSPRRVLRTSDNERPLNTGRTSRRRVFRPAPDEQPANINTSRSRRVIRSSDNDVQRQVSRPQPEYNIQRSQPQERSFTPRSTSNSSGGSLRSSSGSGAPVRSFRR